METLPSPPYGTATQTAPQNQQQSTKPQGGNHTDILILSFAAGNKQVLQ